MKLSWSPEAIDDLTSVREYIAAENPKAARDVVLAITTLIERQLPQFPNSGRPGRVENTLELVVPGLPFVVPYRVRGQTIEVIRVYHTSRRWPDSF